VAEGVGNVSKNKAKDSGKTVSLALSWDGSPAHVSELPIEVRSFLSRSQWPILLNPKEAVLDQALEAGSIKEIRIGWVPSLSGGTVSFTPKMLDRRVPFKLVWRRSLRGYVLTVYRPEVRV
jgi:hypothetical protein